MLKTTRNYQTENLNIGAETQKNQMLNFKQIQLKQSQIGLTY